MNPLNTRFNKASWSAAASALITLVNGRLPTDMALDATEQGLLMTIVTFAVVLLVPNAEAPDA
ncbi:MAG TPA: hypothetical protein ENH62_10110 [Marinobacter sp.]|uniref:Uncharacterized protein n=1 Tax=marine sediment metagenome TaxID=412755 RepID=A0A0F9LZ48_9ZZZZ|nr:hypothetical protein [Marinobacter sp.]